jgi:hypothetical protein
MNPRDTVRKRGLSHRVLCKYGLMLMAIGSNLNKKREYLFHLCMLAMDPILSHATRRVQ